MKHLLIVATTLGLMASSLSAFASTAPRGDVQRGQELSASCAACHGATGDADNPDFPRLAGQYSDYIAYVMRAYRSGERQNPIMNGIAADLSNRDINDLAAFFAAQSGTLHVKQAPRL